MAEQPKPKARLRSKWLLAGGSTAAALLLVALLELVLAVFGVGEIADEDPFFDYEAVTGLFGRVETTGGPVYRTRQSKLAFFNPQQFPVTKGAEVFRVLALGGSTTFGRPYDWQVAFPNWLGHLLRASQPGRDIEVVNAGGVSYASYRIRVLLEELLRYEPDLIVLYTGQNEFLEERVYGDRLRESAWLRTARRELSGLRTVRWLRGLLAPAPVAEKQSLSAEVETRLDVWEGLDSFERDDALRAHVVSHFEWNIDAMVRLSAAHGVPIVLVAPASNARDFSPFKSEHRPDLDAATREAFTKRYEAGVAALAAGRPAPALVAFEQALALDAEYADLHFRIGKAQLALGRPRDAEAAFRLALELDVCPLRAVGAIEAAVRRVATALDVPLVDLPAVLAERGRRQRGHAVLGNEDFLDHVHLTIEVHQQVAEALARIVAERGWLRLTHELTEAERAAIYAKVLQGLEPDYYAQRDLKLAKVLGWSGKYAEATEALMRARDQLAGDVEVHYNLGVLLERQGRNAEALVEYRAAIAAQPDSFEVQFHIGKTLQAMGRDDEARAAFRQASALQPEAAEQHPERTRSFLASNSYNLATSALRAGAFGDAVRALDDVARRDPDFVGLHLLRGRVLLAQRDAAKAVAVLQQSASRQPQLVEAHYYLGLARLGSGDLAGAEQAMRRALSLEADSVPVWRGLAQILDAGNQDQEAVMAYRAAIERAPGEATLWFELGALHHRRQRLEPATKYYSKAVAIDPEYAKAYNDLGAVLVARRDFAGATAAFARAVELTPDDALAHYNLAQLALAAGDRARARQHLARAVQLGIEPSAAIQEAIGK